VNALVQERLQALVAAADERDQAAARVTHVGDCNGTTNLVVEKL
jgi:hypothetical protein